MSRCCTTCNNDVTIKISEKDVDRIKELARQQFKNATQVPDNTLLILSGLENFLRAKGITIHFTVVVKAPEVFHDSLHDD